MEPSRKPAHVPLRDEIFARISKAVAALRRVLPEQAFEPNASVTSGGSAHNTSTASISDIVTAFAEIAEMRKILPRGQSLRSAEAAAALREYQLMLKQFKATLPCIQGWLLTERTRLANRRSHSTAVESWLRTSRQTRW